MGCRRGGRLHWFPAHIQPYQHRLGHPKRGQRVLWARHATTSNPDHAFARVATVAADDGRRKPPGATYGLGAVRAVGGYSPRVQGRHRSAPDLFGAALATSPRGPVVQLGYQRAIRQHQGQSVLLGSGSAVPGPVLVLSLQPAGAAVLELPGMGEGRHGREIGELRDIDATGVHRADSFSSSTNGGSDECVCRRSCSTR